MRVLDPPAAPVAAAWEGWAVRRDWQGGHEFVGYRRSEDDALAFALVDQRRWASRPSLVTHSVARMNVLAYEMHVGKLCTSADCPQGTVVAGAAWTAVVGRAR